MKRSEIIAALQAQGRLPAITKADAGAENFYSETLPTAVDAQAVNVFSQQELGKLAKKSKDRDMGLLTYDIASHLSAPKPNIPKAAAMSGYTVAGKEGAAAVGEEFKKYNAKQLYDKGKEIVEEGSGVWDKTKRIGSKLLTGAGEALNMPGGLLRNAIMSVHDSNVDFNPIAVAMGAQDVPGVDAGKFREWTKTSPELIPKAYQALGNVGEVAGGVVGTPFTAGYQKLKDPSKDVDWKEAWSDAAKWGGDTTVDLFSNPLNAFALGGGTATKNALQQGTKMAAASGLKGAAAKQAAEKFAEFSAKEALGSVGAGRKAMQYASELGISKEAFEKFAGKGGEFLGERGLNVLGKNIGNMEGKALLSRTREALADKFGIDIWKLNAQDRKAFLHSISKMKDLTEAEVAEKIQKSWAAKAPADKAKILGDKKKLKEYAEGWVKNKARDPAKAEQLAIKHGKDLGLEGDDLAAFVAEDIKNTGVQTSYLQRQMSAKAKSHADMAARLQEQGLISPKELGAMKSEASRRLRPDKPLIEFNSPVLKWGKDKADKFTKGVVDIQREGMFASPAYQGQNIKDDLLIGLISGGDTLRGWGIARRAKRATPDTPIFNDAFGKSVTKKQFLDEALEDGVIGGADRLTGDSPLSAENIARAISGKSVDTGFQKFGNAVNLGLSNPGKKLAKKWDDSHRLALYAEYRAQGLNSKAAAQKVNDIAFNYKDPGEFPGLLKVAKAFNPFIGWGYRAVTRVAKHALANPMKANLLPAASRNLSGEAKYAEDKVPSYMKKNLVVQLPDSMKGFINKGLSAIGAETLQEGEGLKATLREPVSGALGVPGETILGTGMTAGPAAKIARGFYGKDEFGRETGVGQELLKMAGGRYLPVATDLASAYKGTVDPFSSRKDNSTTPKRDAVFRAIRSITGETIMPTSPKAEAQELMYNDEQKARLEKLMSSPGATKGKMTRAAIIKKLREQGRL